MVIEHDAHPTVSADNERPVISAFDSRAKSTKTSSDRSLHTRFLAWNNGQHPITAVLADTALANRRCLAIGNRSPCPEHEPTVRPQRRRVPRGPDRITVDGSKAEEGGGSSTMMTAGDLSRPRQRPGVVPPAGFEPAIFTLKG